jgi:hypothetical protein
MQHSHKTLFKMKKLLILFFCVLATWSCTDEGLAPSNQSTTIKDQFVGTEIPSYNPFGWYKLAVPQMDGYPFNSANGKNKIIPVGSDIYCLIAGEYEVVYKLNTTTKRWALFDDVHGMSTPFAVGYQYLFSFKKRFYYGLWSEDGYVSSLDPVTGTRVEAPTFPGIAVGDPLCFSIGTKGYLMGGVSYITGKAVNQFWEYDFISNQWTNKGAMPGGARADGLAFVANGKVYFGLGHDHFTLGTQIIKRLKRDWYVFDVNSGIAISKADFPGTARREPKGFVLNNKVYAGWGTIGTSGNFSYLTDFWEYSPIGNTWVQRQTCAATTNEINNINVFAYDNQGYLVKGWLAEYWRYTPYQ